MSVVRSVSVLHRRRDATNICGLARVFVKDVTVDNATDVEVKRSPVADTDVEVQRSPVAEFDQPGVVGLIGAGRGIQVGKGKRAPEVPSGLVLFAHHLFGKPSHVGTVLYIASDEVWRDDCGQRTRNDGIARKGATAAAAVDSALRFSSRWRHVQGPGSRAIERRHLPAARKEPKSRK